MPTRDEVFLRSFGTPPPTIRPDVGQSTMGRANAYKPDVAASIASAGVPLFYIPFTPELYKSYVQNPTNQGQRAAIASRQSAMFDPRNNPSRSQVQQGYTDPIQLFASGNTWNTDAGLASKGDRGNQPSTKKVSPFASLPIPTRMPWDL